jgi:hypothetical protein
MSDFWDRIHNGRQPNPGDSNIAGLRYMHCAICCKTPSNLGTYAVTRKRGGIVCGNCWENARMLCDALDN